MKVKQIEKLLKGVYNNFLESISDKKVQKILSQDSFITGGCIPSMIMDEWVNDYDIYLTSFDAVCIINKYFENEHFKDKNKKYHVSLITENSVNLSDKIQIITKFYGSPEEVTHNFDWKHIKSYFTLNDGITLVDDVYKLIVEKELVYTGSNYPLSSLLRLRKYLKKGWLIDTPNCVSLALDIASAFNRTTCKDMIENETEIEEEHTTIENRMFDYENDRQVIDMDTLIQQLNGVDPLTIQPELEKYFGKQLSFNEVIDILSN